MSAVVEDGDSIAIALEHVHDLGDRDVGPHLDLAQPGLLGSIERSAHIAQLAREVVQVAGLIVAIVGEGQEDDGESFGLGHA